MMPGHQYFWLKFISSICELLGVFLLSIEAIKLDNFRKLQESAIKLLKNIINPEIIFIDSNEKGKKPIKDKFIDLINDEFTWYTISIIILGVIIIFTLSKIFLQDNTSLIALIKYYVPGPSLVKFIIGWFIFIWLNIITGLIFYTALVGLFTLSILILNIIDIHTPSGAIGILGFLLFLIGFIIKNYIEFTLIEVR